MNIDEFKIGGNLPVRRFGFGAMRLTGKGVWGPPENLSSAQAVLRRAIAQGRNCIAVADPSNPAMMSKTSRHS